MANAGAIKTDIKVAYQKNHALFLWTVCATVCNFSNKLLNFTLHSCSLFSDSCIGTHVPVGGDGVLTATPKGFCRGRKQHISCYSQADWLVRRCGRQPTTPRRVYISNVRRISSPRCPKQLLNRCKKIRMRKGVNRHQRKPAAIPRSPHAANR